MDSKQRGVINIVYSALTGKKVSLPESFEFSEAVKIARRHKIEVLFYYGALNCGLGQEEPLMQELFMLVCGNIAVSEQQLYAVKEIFSAFNEQKIDYLPLKGTVLKELYPKPEMRSMGDADILIKTEQYDKIKAVMQKLGYTEIVESDHEFIWNKQNVHIELHKRLIPSYNKDYYEYFGYGWQLAIESENGTTEFKMSDEDQMIFLFTHFAKHYRNSGIGIRHIVDLWVYRQNKTKLNEDYIERELKKLQLNDFYVNILKTLEVWFGDGQDNDKTDLITQIIFNSGVYGTHETRVLSNAYKKTISGENVKNVRITAFLKTAFLPYKFMADKYPVLKKIPILLPIMWVVRFFDILIFKRDKIKTQINDFETSSAERITDYGQALNYVGLDFNFKE